MSAVAETAVVFLGLNSLAWPYLIATGKLHSPKPRRGTKTTAARAEADTAPSAQAAGQTTLLTAVPDRAAAAAVVDDAERRAKRLPKLRPLEETKQPRLAAFARERERDPRTGQFLKRQAS